MQQARVYEFDDSTLQIPIDDPARMNEFIQLAKSGEGLFRTDPGKMTESSFPLANFFAKAFGYDAVEINSGIHFDQQDLLLKFFYLF